MNEPNSEWPGGIFELDESDFFISEIMLGTAKSVVQIVKLMNKKEVRFREIPDAMMPIISPTSQELTPLVILPGEEA